MTVLFLGAPESPALAYLRGLAEPVVASAEPLTDQFLDRHDPDFLVSHGYRHIVRPAVIERFPDRIVNLHISYLPWNRGADPTFWSIREDTPKGVTIHYMDAGVDTGDIIAQKSVEPSPGDTLRTTYQRLQDEIVKMFETHWAQIRSGECDRCPQAGGGSSHRTGDLESLRHLLVSGWDTPIASLAPGSTADLGR